MSQDQLQFLSCYLTRNLLDYQTSNQKHKDQCIIMEKVVRFLIDFFKLINDQIKNFGLKEHLLSKHFDRIYKI